MSVRRYLQSCNPYISLVVLALPVAIVEPLKLVGVWVFGTGHFLTGTIVIASAYTGSLLVVHRLFKIVKANLLRLSWFTWLWQRYLRLKRKAWRFLRSYVAAQWWASR